MASSRSTSRLLLLPRRNRSPEVWSLRTILGLLSSEQLTCEELSRYCYSTARAGEEIWQLNAYSRLSSWERIEKAAKDSDERRRHGESKSLLDGIPISIKANLAVESQPLTAGSQILGQDVPHRTTNPVGYNAAVVDQLIEDCGAICIGITNMDEFGMGSLGTNIADSKATKNPLSFLPHQEEEEEEEEVLSTVDILRQTPEEINNLHQQFISVQPYYYSAGGSSCGAAVSVAHGSSLIALGSDTGGSIRLPAAWCGVVGMKPSYGRINRHGLVSYASSLDTVGFLTRTVDCASLVVDELKEHPPKHSHQDSTYHQHFSVGGGLKPTTMETAATTSSDSSKLPLEGIRIGVPAAFVVEECPDHVKDAWAQGAATLQEAGATVVPIEGDVVDPSIIQQSLAAYYVLASAEASSNLARYDGFRYGVAAAPANEESTSSSSKEGTALQRQYSATRTQGFGQEVIRRVLCGTAVLSSDKFHTHYEAAAKLRALVTQQLEDALTLHADYLLIPTVVSPPPRLPIVKSGDTEDTIDSTAMFGNDIMTVSVSLAGLAAVSIPQCSSEPTLDVERVIGLQLVGPRLQEENLLRVSKHLEK